MKLLFVVMSMLMLSCSSTVATMHGKGSFETYVSQLPEGTITELNACSLRQYDLYSYFFQTYLMSKKSKLVKDEKVQHLRIDHMGSQIVAITTPQNGEGALSIAILGRNSKTPVLGLADKNGDGKYDALTYSVQDQDGNDIVMTSDINFDGQPDNKIEYKTGNKYAWVEDAWREIIIKNRVRGVEIKGQWIKIEFMKGGWQRAEE